MTPNQQPEFQLPPFFAPDEINLADFEAVCWQTTDLTAFPLASSVERNIPIYFGDTFRQAVKEPEGERMLKVELCRLLKDGPGVFVVRDAYEDKAVIDRSTNLFRQIVAAEEASGQGQGDHFGQNERIWNAIQKACLRDPDHFIDYYGNPVLAVACEAWLGPGYQITAQMNNVKPGSQPQAVHRDYHLGFQSPASVARYPAHAQVMSQYLTLQGAIVHTDMPLISGPTLLLPYSHRYLPGYLAYTRPEFKSYFDEHKVQLPLAKGDTVFFTPALFHGAGSNGSQSDRIANLVQVSSAFGRAMETVDYAAMATAVYPALLTRVEAGAIDDRQIADTIAAAADGYSFPTNLDADPPLGGNAPETAQQLMRRALDARWPATKFQEHLAAHRRRRRA